MASPGQPKTKKKRDPQQNRINQRCYRERKKAAVDGMEEVRAQNRRRYHERITRMKASGVYEAFKAKKTAEGMRRYHRLSEEKRNEIRCKNRLLNKAWIERMKEEGTFMAYKQRLNARRREKVAQKRQAMGVEAWKALQKQRYTRPVASQTRQRWEWLDKELERPFPLTWLPLDWAESEPEEDTVQTDRANELQQMNHYL